VLVARRAAEQHAEVDRGDHGLDDRDRVGAGWLMMLRRLPRACVTGS
jgi:hypothetical protein